MLINGQMREALREIDGQISKLESARARLLDGVCMTPQGAATHAAVSAYLAAPDDRAEAHAGAVLALAHAYIDGDAPREARYEVRDAIQRIARSRRAAEFLTAAKAAALLDVLAQLGKLGKLAP